MLKCLIQISLESLTRLEWLPTPHVGTCTLICQQISIYIHQSPPPLLTIYAGYKLLIPTFNSRRLSRAPYDLSGMVPARDQRLSLGISNPSQKSFLSLLSNINMNRQSRKVNFLVVGCYARKGRKIYGPTLKLRDHPK